MSSVVGLEAAGGVDERRCVAEGKGICGQGPASESPQVSAMPDVGMSTAAPLGEHPVAIMSDSPKLLERGRTVPGKNGAVL